MDAGEALDREVIVERAEALRGWLSTLSLSSRATSALNRELDGIIANDPGGYINGQRPLAGLTVADFVVELHRASAGAVGRVKSVGNSLLTELRAVIPPDAATSAAQPEPQISAEPAAAEDGAAGPDDDLPEAAQATPQDEAPPRRGRGRPKGSTRAARERDEAPAQAAEVPAPDEPQAAEPQAAEPQAAEPQAAEVAPDAAAPRRRGRPRKSEAPAPTAPDAAAPRRRGRPRKSEAPAPTAPVARGPATNGRPPAGDRDSTPALRAAQPDQRSVPATLPRQPDPALEQIMRLWPSLHPAARRAIVLYASSLLAEGAYEV